ncbi:Rha family transcriptional regulator [Endozoicomonas sp. SCSIO W0465]|uniref:Rha family transcriptional regulator n=1 Tax=Endozoicomonas sp. SCSIO W0465 TaxID=2918516 RepID=UPI0020758618|nr:Rha family transcriptional regulator [Endozoicomonas sp. SCSIO W0465]USE36757.1 Rha family transcriptional regulator [Endozoicomonas sp. SCSIO W0465]
MEQQNTALGFLNINSDVETMSSCEIADLTGKQHAHVKRDIENMCIQMEWDVSKFGGIYIDAQNRKQTEYRLPRFESEVLITGYDVQRRAAVIQRWYALESGQSQPMIQQENQPSPHQLLELHMDASLKAITFAREFGLNGNQAMLAADRMVKKRLDFSPLEEMGHPALIAPVKAPLYTVTELGKLSDPVFSAVNMNLHLHDHGLQVRVGDQWTPTDKGKPFCEMLDVGKHHGDGTPVKQLKWYASVLPTLTKPWRRYITPKPAEKTPAPEPKPTPPTVAEDQPDTGKPVITRQHKSRRSSDRMRGRYGLPDHFSIYELADELELQKGYIEDVLKKHRIIKWKPMKHSGKFVLTDTGWHYGKMYDPSTKQFREKGKRVMTTQCQPVFGYDILKFFM